MNALSWLGWLGANWILLLTGLIALFLFSSLLLYAVTEETTIWEALLDDFARVGQERPNTTGASRASADMLPDEAADGARWLTDDDPGRTFPAYRDDDDDHFDHFDHFDSRRKRQERYALWRRTRDLERDDPDSFA